jgi:hypothetical protein
MDLPPHCDRLPVAKPPLRLPTTSQEAATLRAWAETQPDRPAPASLQQISKHLSFIAAAIPGRAMDEESGKKRVAVYSSILADFSNDALSYLARKACETCDWFPTPRQCLEILRKYRPPASDRDKALMLYHRFWDGRFEEFMATLRSGTATERDIATAPRQWRAIAMEQGYLRWIDDEKRYVIRLQPSAAAAGAV